MERFLRCTFVLIFFTSFCWVGASVWAIDPMADFYNGLADVVDRNANLPEVCVAEAETYIKENIQSLGRSPEKRGGMRMLQDGIHALNRFMESIQRLSKKYPGDAERIMDTLSRYLSKGDSR